MSGRLEPFRARLRVYLRWAIALTVAFTLVYGGTNEWTAQRMLRLHFYSEWELAIPYLPEAVLVYVSIQLLFLLPLWVLNVEAMARLGRAMLAAILVGGMLFLILPTQLGYSRPSPESWLTPLYSLIYLLDRPHNLFPSLHVALSTLVLLFLARCAGRRPRLFYVLWWLLLCASVLLTHQHHLLDVAGGLALGVGCYARFGDGRSPATTSPCT